MVTKLKCAAWHCSVWVVWFFEEKYEGYGHYSSPFSDLCLFIFLLPLAILTSPIWLPILGIAWSYSKMKTFADSPSPCENKK